MTTIPVDLGWLILAAFILITVTVYLASYEAQRDATRHQRKWMEEHELAVYKHEDALREREDAVQEREAELGRKAHDLAAQTQVVLRQANSRDTVPTMQEL